jgi:hypothetical protein
MVRPPDKPRTVYVSLEGNRHLTLPTRSQFMCHMSCYGIWKRNVYCGRFRDLYGANIARTVHRFSAK